MGLVDCSVKTCSYNKSGDCFAGTINIGGKSASEKNCTCCGSYLNEKGYSNLAEYTSMRGKTDNILCAVGTCVHNGEGKCDLDKIQVAGEKDAEYYTATQCRSFERIDE